MQASVTHCSTLARRWQVPRPGVPVLLVSRKGEALPRPLSWAGWGRRGGRGGVQASGRQLEGDGQQGAQKGRKGQVRRVDRFHLLRSLCRERLKTAKQRL